MTDARPLTAETLHMLDGPGGVPPPPPAAAVAHRQGPGGDVSPLDLNGEPVEIEKPWRAMLRRALTGRRSGGGVAGIVIINSRPTS